MFNLKKMIDVIKNPNSDWDKKLNASDNIVENYDKQCSDEILNSLIELLSEENHEIKNIAALVLREIGDNRAVFPLLKQINSPKNKENKSIFVYALENLDCKDLFLDIIKLLDTKKADVWLSVLSILLEQNFNATLSDLENASKLVKNFSLGQEFKETVLERIEEIKEYVILAEP